jgi:hypothetical protein
MTAAACISEQPFSQRGAKLTRGSRQDVLEHGRDLAHEVALRRALLGRALLVVVLEVVIDGDDALRRELLDLLGPVLPRLDVYRREASAYEVERAVAAATHKACCAAAVGGR